MDLELDIDVDLRGPQGHDEPGWRPESEETVAVESARADDGELYGVHTPPATDRALPDNDRAFATGQTWTEALEERSTEGGPLPEHEIDVVDETADVHPNTETKDRPIADLGSGGRGGL